MKIILAEDDDGNLLVGRTILANLGYQFEVARTGQQAVDLCKTGQYSLILMDVRMPEMDGFEATRIIRDWERAEGHSPVPIVGLTAKTLTGDKENCIECGMDDYMPKPIEIAMLQQKLERWLNLPAA